MLQHLIAFLVAVTVVDALEVIDIQQQKGQRRAVFAGAVERLLSTLEEVPAVAALGQHIGGGQALQLPFKLLLFGDVFGDTDNDHPVAIVLLGDVLSELWPRWLMLLGVILILVVVFMRGGLWGGLAELGKRLLATRSANDKSQAKTKETL